MFRRTISRLISFLRSWLVPAACVGQEPLEHSRAFEIVRRLNGNCLIGIEGQFVCAIEDHADDDGRIFRLEYQSTFDGRRAVAWCRYNPWGSVSDVHTTGGGLICLGTGHSARPTASPFDLETAVLRARFWCTAVSVFHETGSFPNL